MDKKKIVGEITLMERNIRVDWKNTRNYNTTLMKEFSFLTLRTLFFLHCWRGEKPTIRRKRNSELEKNRSVIFLLFKLRKCPFWLFHTSWRQEVKTYRRSKRKKSKLKVRVKMNLLNSEEKMKMQCKWRRL